MEFWHNFIDLGMFSILLAVATILKNRISFFKKYLIPNSMIAGFIGLIIGQELLNLYQFDIDRLGKYVYHLMAIGFIALSLKSRKKSIKQPLAFKTGAILISTYLIQGIAGFTITIILASTFMKDLFPPFGLLLPLGFGQGPGQAFSIGSRWENIGFQYGGNIGLSISTFGFLWACFGGVILMNILKKKSPETFEKNIDSVNPHETESDTDREIPLSSSIDRLTIQLSLIGIIYLLTFATLSGLSFLLKNAGSFGSTFSDLLWGFHFIIGSVYGLLFRTVYDWTQKKKIIFYNYPNNYLLSRISGTAFDYMIATAIAAISITVLYQYLLPILLICVSGGLITIIYLFLICRRVYKQYTFEYIIVLFGNLTGTISTAMALLREIDPNFKTNAAENLVIGSGFGLFMGLPMMLVLNIPVIGYINNQPVYYLISLLLLIVYFLFLVFLTLFQKKSEKE